MLDAHKLPRQTLEALLSFWQQHARAQTGLYKIKLYVITPLNAALCSNETSLLFIRTFEHMDASVTYKLQFKN
jgi:hypothetical protein